MERFENNQAFITLSGNQAAINIYLLQQMHRDDQAALELLNKQLDKIQELKATLTR